MGTKGMSWRVELSSGSPLESCEEGIWILEKQKNRCSLIYIVFRTTVQGKKVYVWYKILEESNWVMPWYMILFVMFYLNLYHQLKRCAI